MPTLLSFDHLFRSIELKFQANFRIRTSTNHWILGKFHWINFELALKVGNMDWMCFCRLFPTSWSMYQHDLLMVDLSTISITKIQGKIRLSLKSFDFVKMDRNALSISFSELFSKSRKDRHSSLAYFSQKYEEKYICIEKDGVQSLVFIAQHFLSSAFLHFFP